jgi:hypothetical protein
MERFFKDPLFKIVFLHLYPRLITEGYKPCAARKNQKKSPKPLKDQPSSLSDAQVVRNRQGAAKDELKKKDGRMPSQGKTEEPRRKGKPIYPVTFEVHKNEVLTLVKIASIIKI